MADLLTKLFLEIVLKALDRAGLGCNCALKVHTLLLNLASQLSELTCDVLSMGLGLRHQGLGLTIKILHLRFQGSHPLVNGCVSVHLHTGLRKFGHDFSNNLLGHIFKRVPNLEGGFGRQIGCRFCPWVMQLDVVAFRRSGHKRLSHGGGHNLGRWWRRSWGVLFLGYHHITVCHAKDLLRRFLHWLDPEHQTLYMGFCRKCLDRLGRPSMFFQDLCHRGLKGAIGKRSYQVSLALTRRQKGHAWSQGRKNLGCMLSFAS